MSCHKKFPHGLLINFGGVRLEIRKLVLGGANDEGAQETEGPAAVEWTRTDRDPGLN